MQDKSLTTQQIAVGIPVPPDVVLSNAMIAAKALKDVISKKAKPVILNGEQYLEFEDWQTCGQFYGYTVKTGEAVAVEVDGVKGAKARADLIDFKTGEIIGGAEAYCMRDEDHWNTRPKYEWQGESCIPEDTRTGPASRTQDTGRSGKEGTIMDVGYCPNCKQAGLLLERVANRHNHKHMDSSLRYCPRCDAWVKPAYKNAR